MNTQDKINSLVIHKDNLLKAQSFEEYRNAHIAYINILLVQFEIDLKCEEAIATLMETEE